jgi:hypothetical protein
MHLAYEEKGDAPKKCASHILVKGDTHCGGASPFYLTCKKEYLQIILHGILLVPTRIMTVGTHMHTYVYQWPRAGLAQEAPRGARAV